MGDKVGSTSLMNGLFSFFEIRSNYPTFFFFLKKNTSSANYVDLYFFYKHFSV